MRHTSINHYSVDATLNSLVIKSVMRHRMILDIMWTSCLSVHTTLVVSYRYPSNSTMPVLAPWTINIFLKLSRNSIPRVVMFLCSHSFAVLVEIDALGQSRTPPKHSGWSKSQQPCNEFYAHASDLSGTPVRINNGYPGIQANRESIQYSPCHSIRPSYTSRIGEAHD